MSSSSFVPEEHRVGRTFDSFALHRTGEIYLDLPTAKIF